jgi:glucosamine-phosphate N-acetyltransferase
MEKIKIKNLDFEEYESYLNLLKQLTNYEYSISKEEFSERYEMLQKTCKILVLKEDDNLVAAGSIIKLVKLHNNPIAQIEDVVVDESYRGKGYGKMMIEALTKIGKEEWGCYKVTLNCLTKNVKFYEKLNYEVVGHQLKFIG